jgi:outer membrane protein assembly factor BamE
MRGQWWNAARAVVAMACACVMLASCKVSPYRIDIQQGNVVTQEMLAKLKPEMSRSQVKFVLGTPVVVDTFHPDRWDYFYKFDKAGNPREQRVLTLVFSDDKLQKIVGDVKAAPGLVEGASAAPADARSKP